MDASALIARLDALMPDLTLTAGAETDQPTIQVPAAQLATVMRALRDTPDLEFAFLADVTAVDWWPNDPRFEVVYHLASFARAYRIRVKVRVSESVASLPTLKEMWPSADWLEREVWDLFGIVFEGHGDLRRLLMPDDWQGHPLRKDYPVQVKVPVHAGEPLQVSEEEFRANIEMDRRVRGGSP
jgi:NADH-quinone oxidoreductase subunit C